MFELVYDEVNRGEVDVTIAELLQANEGLVAQLGLPEELLELSISEWLQEAEGGLIPVLQDMKRLSAKLDYKASAAEYDSRCWDEIAKLDRLLLLSKKRYTEQSGAKALGSLVVSTDEQRLRLIRAVVAAVTTIRQRGNSTHQIVMARKLLALTTSRTRLPGLFREAVATVGDFSFKEMFARQLRRLLLTHDNKEFLEGLLSLERFVLQKSTFAKGDKALFSQLMLQLRIEGQQACLFRAIVSDCFGNDELGIEKLLVEQSLLPRRLLRDEGSAHGSAMLLAAQQRLVYQKERGAIERSFSANQEIEEVKVSAKGESAIRKAKRDYQVVLADIDYIAGLMQRVGVEGREAIETLLSAQDQYLALRKRFYVGYREKVSPLYQRYQAEMVRLQAILNTKRGDKDYLRFEIAYYNQAQVAEQQLREAVAPIMIKYREESKALIASYEIYQGVCKQRNIDVIEPYGELQKVLGIACGEALREPLPYEEVFPKRMGNCYLSTQLSGMDEDKVMQLQVCVEKIFKQGDSQAIAVLEQWMRGFFVASEAILALQEDGCSLPEGSYGKAIYEMLLEVGDVQLAKQDREQTTARADLGLAGGRAHSISVSGPIPISERGIGRQQSWHGVVAKQSFLKGEEKVMCQVGSVQQTTGLMHFRQCSDELSVGGAKFSLSDVDADSDVRRRTRSCAGAVGRNRSTLFPSADRDVDGARVANRPRLWR